MKSYLLIPIMFFLIGCANPGMKVERFFNPQLAANEEALRRKKYEMNQLEAEILAIKMGQESDSDPVAEKYFTSFRTRGEKVAFLRTIMSNKNISHDLPLQLLAENSTQFEISDFATLLQTYRDFHTRLPAPKQSPDTLSLR